MRPRPPVVVYITREHPETGVDELLVFDIPDEPAVEGIVPGGGIEPGETVEETARREAREETGIEIGAVREVGRVEDSHFEWEHRKQLELVRCRWVTLRPTLELWGERGALVSALIRRRVVAYVTREHVGTTELLTIEHERYPEEGIQVPAGRIEHDETLGEGLRRELAEETGVTGVRVVRELPGFEAEYETFSDNHAFHLVAEEETPEAWRHEVRGEGVDAGLIYVCRWLPLSADLRLWNRGDPMLKRLPI